MAIRLSLRPDLDQNVDGLPLYISGLLPGMAPMVAYEGRLKINNAIGRCSVQVLDGSDKLPPGSTVYVDHATQQIVVAWPPYSQSITPLENPGFETGNTAGWTFIPRGGSAVPVIDASYRYEGSRSLKWPGGRGMGSEGGIEVEAWNNTIGPCLPGRRVTTRFRGMYNPSGHNFGCQYRAMVRFIDGGGSPIGVPQRGQVIKGRGQNGRWNDAFVSASAPDGTVGVQLGGWLTGSNAPTWMDAASWDVPTEIGVSTSEDYALILRVRDGAGRTAIWSGWIRFGSTFVTSKLFGIVMNESVSVGFQIQEMALDEVVISLDAPSEFPAVGYSLHGFTFVTSEIPAQIERSGVAFSMQGFTLKSVLIQASSSQPANVAFSLQGFTLRAQPTAESVANVGAAFAIQGFTFS